MTSPVCNRLFVGSLIALVTSSVVGAPPDSLDFSRDIRPLFAEYCLDCHGSDSQNRQGNFRLDSAEALKHPEAIVPGQSDRSQLIARITSTDPDFTMPPPAVDKRLSKNQIDVLRRWIDDGAEWPGHWAFQSVCRPTTPDQCTPSWNRSGIDPFIAQKHARHQLVPSPPADISTWVRRLSLDLTGLPPTVEILDEMLREDIPDAAERLIDRTIHSPHYGERMAQQWLDLARYGDSDGYHDDTPRVVYQFRNYVIESFNRGKPFDQFTVEQLAGDLLPGATLEQQIGSAFHRLGPTSSEGGADAAEYHAKYAVDRVNTTATVWMGVTLQCTECHDHKYDPFTTREFYQLFAFFDQVPEDVLFRGNDSPPIINTPDEGQQQREFALRRQKTELEAELDRRLREPHPELEAARLAWEQRASKGELDTPNFSPWHGIGPFFEVPGTMPFDYQYPPELEVDLQAAYDEGKLRWEEQRDWIDGTPHYLPGDKCATYAYRTVHVDHRQPLTLYLGSDDGIKVWVNGKLVHQNILVRIVAPNQDRVPIVLEPGQNTILLKIVNLQGGYGFYFSTKEKDKDERAEELIALTRLPAEQRTQEQQRKLKQLYFSQYIPEIRDIAAAATDIDQQLSLLARSIPKLRVMADPPQRRPTHLLARGDYRVPGELVEPDVPASLGPLVSSRLADRPANPPANRLDLARWLVDRKHPLTARVTMNRYWQLLFGQGIVRTTNDFGVRGDPPTHPDLLDWLAAEFMDSGWDTKKMIRSIVVSSTYRQSSRLSAVHQELDPEDRWLARMTRQRLPAETIHDHALAVSGLLSRRIGGPSVKPYQPGDLWREMAYGDQPDRAYVQDHGESLYRRGIYTFWKRSIHFPAFALFDAPSREVCTTQRPITNTPLQALVTLNDVTYVESARVLSQSLLGSDTTTFEDRIRYLMRTILGRSPRDEEWPPLRRLHDRLVDDYRGHLAEAMAITQVGEFPRPTGIELVELAVWTSISQALMNLDEALTKE